jgi:hypothetical protein
MITHLKIRVLYAMCFLVVKAVKAKMLSTLVYHFYWAPVNIGYVLEIATLLLYHVRGVCVCFCISRFIGFFVVVGRDSAISSSCQKFLPSGWCSTGIAQREKEAEDSVVGLLSALV